MLFLEECWNAVVMIRLLLVVSKVPPMSAKWNFWCDWILLLWETPKDWNSLNLDNRVIVELLPWCNGVLSVRNASILLKLKWDRLEKLCDDEVSIILSFLLYAYAIWFFPQIIKSFTWLAMNRKTLVKNRRDSWACWKLYKFLCSMILKKPKKLGARIGELDRPKCEKANHSVCTQHTSWTEIWSHYNLPLLLLAKR